MRRLRTLLILSACFGTPAASGGELPEWVGKIRPDHPRLFFNADTWPTVKERALGAEKAWYERARRRAERLVRELADGKSGARDRGCPARRCRGQAVPSLLR